MKWLKAMAAVAAMGAGVAQAATITDVVEQDHYVGNWGSYSYSHDITDDGFVLGSAISGTLQLSIYDDSRFDLPEIILIVVDAFDFDTGGLTFGSFSNALDIEALATLNADGTLGIKVTSLLGDFYVGDSVLTVETREVSDVPVPGTLGLLGLGLAGLGLVRRRTTA